MTALPISDLPPNPFPKGDEIFDQTPAGTVRVEVLFHADTVWLSQKREAVVFGVELPTVSCHLAEIDNSGELWPEATLRRSDLRSLSLREILYPKGRELSGGVNRHATDRETGRLPCCHPASRPSQSACAFHLPHRHHPAPLRLPESDLRPGSYRPTAASTAQCAAQATLQKSGRVRSGQNRTVRRGIACRSLPVIPPLYESDGQTYTGTLAAAGTQRLAEEHDHVGRACPGQQLDRACELEARRLAKQPPRPAHGGDA